MSVQRRKYSLVVSITGGGNERDFKVTVKGTPKKFVVWVHNHEKAFGPDAVLDKDVIYWVDKMHYPRLGGGS